MVKAFRSDTITLQGRRVDYRLIRSKTARKFRVRVGPHGVEVVQPHDGKDEKIAEFLRANEDWVLSQIERVERLPTIGRPVCCNVAEILFRGEPVPVRVETVSGREGPNKVVFGSGTLVIRTGLAPSTPPERSLENWLRREARAAIMEHMKSVTHLLRRSPGKVYVMGQRTKWGNCSSLGNLSFNWRLIMAPDFVLRYVVTHEAVHLAVPDHSQKFWLTIQSLCPEMVRAKQWLSANGDKLLLSLR